MKTFVCSAIALLCASSLLAQLATPTTGIPGKLHVSVDDTAKIFLNGELVHDAPVSASVSREITLRAGDRLVAQLHNIGGPRRFKMVFAAADGRSAISFRRAHYKVIPELTQNDFTSAEWVKWNRQSREEVKAKGDNLPLKNTADWVWGEDDVCSIGALVVAPMFAASSPASLSPATDAKSDFPVVLTVEGHVDGPSTLYVRKDGVLWVNGQNAKPGYGREPTYINGEEWLPKWGVPGKERGVDRSDIFPLTLETLDLKAELVSNMSERGVTQIDPSRTPVQIKRRTSDFEIQIPDPQGGARWYKFEFRSRKK